MNTKDKTSALKTALTQLDKQFGLGTVMRLGDKPKADVNTIPTGAINLDAALGIGGIPSPFVRRAPRWQASIPASCRASFRATSSMRMTAAWRS